MTPFRLVWWLTRVVLWATLFAAIGYGIFTAGIYAVASLSNWRAERRAKAQEDESERRAAATFDKLKKTEPSWREVCADPDFQSLAESEKEAVLTKLHFPVSTTYQRIARVACLDGSLGAQPVTDSVAATASPGFIPDHPASTSGSGSQKAARRKRFGNAKVVPDLTLFWGCNTATLITSLNHGQRVKILPDGSAVLPDGRHGCFQGKDEIQMD